MPLTDGPPGSQVFYNTTNILDYARLLANDAQGGIEGQNLADSRPVTWPLLNFCYGRLANWLEDNNVESAMYAEAVITVPASAVYADPSARSRLGYEGFQDAAGNFYDTPSLPPDLLEPLYIEQRISGLNVPFAPMKQKLGGLGTSWNYGWSGGTYGSIYGPWEFRQNSIYFLGGAYAATDFNIRYVPSVVTLTQPTPELPDPPIIWFAKAGEALALWIAYTYARTTGGANAPALKADLEEELQILANRSAKRENRAQTRKKGYGFNRRRRSSWL